MAPSLYPYHQSNCQHNHNPRGAVSSKAKDTLSPSIVSERVDDIRTWYAGGVSVQDIFNLLQLNQGGRLLCRVGKKKVVGGCTTAHYCYEICVEI